MYITSNEALFIVSQFCILITKYPDLAFNNKMIIVIKLLLSSRKKSNKLRQSFYFISISEIAFSLPAEFLLPRQHNTKTNYFECPGTQRGDIFVSDATAES